MRALLYRADVRILVAAAAVLLNAGQSAQEPLLRYELPKSVVLGEPVILGVHIANSTAGTLTVDFGVVVRHRVRV
jgi:hypothetical protein